MVAIHVELSVLTPKHRCKDLPTPGTSEGSKVLDMLSQWHDMAHLLYGPILLQKSKQQGDGCGYSKFHECIGTRFQSRRWVGADLRPERGVISLIVENCLLQGHVGKSFKKIIAKVLVLSLYLRCFFMKLDLQCIKDPSENGPLFVNDSEILGILVDFLGSWKLKVNQFLDNKIQGKGPV